MTPIDVLYEDNHLIAVNKTNNDIVQGDKTGDTPLSELLKQYLKEKYHKPGKVFLGVVHRLDRPTSGVVVFAKTSKALSRMNRLFQQKGEVKKIYWAVTDTPPSPPAGQLVHHLVRNEKKNKSFAYDSPRAQSKLAELTYEFKQAADRYVLLEVELHTGRHHQIRAQFAAKGWHIKGDLKYGFPRSNPNAGIHLHARILQFEHPVKKIPVRIVAAPPKDPLWDFFTKKLGE